jgi:DNA gyrase subunit A
MEDLIAPEDMVVTCSHTGYVKRSPVALYRSQRRGGKGRIGMKTREEDWVEHLFVAGTLEHVLVFTTSGRLHAMKVHEIPEVGTSGKGQALVNLLSFAPGERVAAFFAVPTFDDERFIVMATRNGVVKKTELGSFRYLKKGGLIALSIDEGDELLGVKLTDGKRDLLLATASGMAIRFPEAEVRPMGRAARGVKGVELREGDRVVAMEVVEGTGSILTVTTKGFGKRTPVEEYRPQGRGGLGLVSIRLVDRKGEVVGVRYVEAGDGVLLATTSGMILRTRAADISETGRISQGVKVIDIGESDEVAALAKVQEKDDERAGEDDPDGGPNAPDSPGAPEPQVPPPVAEEDRGNP